MRSNIRTWAGFLGVFAAAACAEGNALDGSGGAPTTAVGPVTSATGSGSGGLGQGGAASTATGAGGASTNTASAGEGGGVTSAGGAGGAMGSGGAGGGGDVSPPTVLSTFPAAGAVGTSPATKLDVTFSEPMLPSSISTHTGSTCAGSLQLSADNFATCVPMVGQPMSGDGTTFTLTPAASLASLGSYRLRVQTSAEDAAGNGLAQPYLLPTPFAVRFFHTIQIDGSNDFLAANEAFASSTPGAQLFVSHDETTLYLGLSSADIVTSGAGNKFAYFLFSVDPTLATGGLQSSDSKAKFGSSSRMSYHYKERIAGGLYSEYRQWNGSDWTLDWTAVGKDSFKQNGYLEASIALSQFGGAVPQALSISAFTVDYDGVAGNGWVYNMLPGATDGAGTPARDLQKHVRLSFPGLSAPNAAANLLPF